MKIKRKLMLGDCLERLKEISDSSVDMVLCDPPYKMTNSGKSSRPNYLPALKNNNWFKGKLLSTFAWMSELYRVIKDESHCYIFCNDRDLEQFLTTAKSVGFKFHGLIVCIKDTKMPNRWYLKYTEYVLFFRKGKAKPINNLCSRNYMMCSFPTLKKGKVHPTQKPIDLLSVFISNSSNKGDTILDPFMGSGSTGVAAMKLRRSFIGIEMDNKYFDVAKNRIKNWKQEVK